MNLTIMQRPWISEIGVRVNVLGLLGQKVRYFAPHFQNYPILGGDDVCMFYSFGKVQIT